MLSAPPSRPSMSMARVVVQSAGFCVGLALLGWCIWKAAAAADLERLRHADLGLVLAMVGVSGISMACAGTAFWLALRRVRPIPWGVHQAVNAMATLVNYAPVRLGVPSRFLYHMTVDRLGAWEVAGWVATVAACTLTALAGLTAGSGAGAAWSEFGLGSVGVSVAVGVVALLGVSEAGVWCVSQIRRIRFVASRFEGCDAMLSSRTVLRFIVLTRFADFAMYATRAWLAGRILGLGLDEGQILLVALAGYIMNYNPLGRFGFREATMAFVASRLAGESGLDVGAAFAQLALVESAGEALASIPLGGIGGAWCGSRILRARRATARGRAPDDAQGVS